MTTDPKNNWGFTHRVDDSGPRRTSAKNATAGTQSKSHLTFWEGRKRDIYDDDRPWFRLT